MSDLNNKSGDQENKPVLSEIEFKINNERDAYKFLVWLVDQYGYQEHPLEILKRAKKVLWRD